MYLIFKDVVTPIIIGGCHEEFYASLISVLTLSDDWIMGMALHKGELKFLIGSICSIKICLLFVSFLVLGLSFCKSLDCSS